MLNVVPEEAVEYEAVEVGDELGDLVDHEPLLVLLLDLLDLLVDPGEVGAVSDHLPCPCRRIGVLVVIPLDILISL